MKKLVKFLPLLLLVAALTAVLAVSASAEGPIPVKQFCFYEYQGSGKGSVYNAAFKAAHDADYSFYGTNNSVAASTFGGMINAIKTWVADKEVDENGRVVVRDGENNITEYLEVCLYINGDTCVSGSVGNVDSTSGARATLSSLSYQASTRDRVCKGSNGNLPTIHVSPLLDGEKTTIYVNSNSTNASTVWTLDNNFHFKNVTVKTLKGTTANAYYSVCCLGYGNYLYMDEGSSMIAGLGTDPSVTKPMTLISGSNWANQADTSVNITLLSGEWSQVIYLAGLRNNMIGDCYFTFGGTAKAGRISGTGNTAAIFVAYDASVGANSKIRNYTGEEENIIANSHVHITGGTIATMRGVFGWDADLTFQGNIDVVVEGDPKIGTETVADIAPESPVFASRYGTVKGNVTVEIKGGTFVDSATEDFDLYICGMSNSVTNGNVTATLSGGTVHSKNSRVRLGTGEVYGDITVYYSGFNALTFYGGAAVMEGNIVHNFTGGSLRNIYAAGASTGSASAHNTLTGSVTINLSGDIDLGANLFGGGNFVDISGNVTVDAEDVTLDCGVFSAGPRSGGGVGGDINVTLNGVNFTKSTFKGVNLNGAEFDFAMASGKKAALTLDLENDVVLPAGVVAADEVTLKAGAGKLVLAEQAAPLTVTSLVGTPEVEIVNAEGGTVYLAVPDGTDESDVVFTVTGTGTVDFANNCYFGFIADPKANTIIMEQDFSMRYFFDRNSMDAAGVTSIQYSTDNVNWKTVSLSDYKDHRYYSALVTGIAAKNIADTIYVKNSATQTVDEYSIAQACGVVIANEDGSFSDEFVTLAKALLNYGASAQTNFDYAGAAITTYDDVPPAAAYADESDLGDKTGKTVVIEGTSLLAKEAISMKFYINVGEENIDDLTVKVNNKVCTPVANGDYYTVSYEVPAKQMRQNAVVTVLKGEDVVSNTYTDSIASYCGYVQASSTDNNLKAFCDSLMAYVDAAIAYLATVN